jgi:hypothetical protein
VVLQRIDRQQNPVEIDAKRQVRVSIVGLSTIGVMSETILTCDTSAVRFIAYYPRLIFQRACLRRRASIL